MFRLTLLVAVLFVFCALKGSAEEHEEKPARWCTISQAEYSKCKSMAVVFEEHDLVPAIECIEKPTAEECLITIREGHADLITLDGGDVFRAGKVFGLKPIMKEIYSGSTGYYGIAVTKANISVSLANLKGAKTCHTGVGRTAGWNIPVGYLLRSGQMKSAGCKEHAKSASQFFSSSCAPGAMLADKNPYGDDLSNLCGICAGDCGRDPDTEPYNGYSGALRCLIEGMGQVAFIKPATIDANIRFNSTYPPNVPSWAEGVARGDLRLLCKDGSRAAIEDAASCHISKGVSHSVMTSGSASSEDIQAYQTLLSDAVGLFSLDDNPDFTMFDSSQWGGRNLLFKDYATTMEPVHDQTYAEYLGGYGESFEGLHKCPDNTIRICTISEQEQQKCRAMRDVFLDEGLTPEISCFPATSHAECIDSIAAGFADVVTLDGGDIYRAGKDHGLIPILGEVYGDTKQTISYWPVAVVKKGTSFSIRDLQGKRSCHTGIMKTSGWIMPVGFLAENGFLDVTGTEEDCDVTRKVGMFFNSSCVPGAKSAEYDVYGTNPENLCDNCIGEDESNCARNSHEPYYGYDGAFRCLVEGKGDVAFVKHSTVRDNTLPKAQDPWNKGLRQRNFEILCPDGTRNYPWKFRKNCHLGKVSSHAMVTSGDKTKREINTIINLFLEATELFKNEEGDDFKIFDSSGFTKDGQMLHYLDSNGQVGKNLIFKDSTVLLRTVPVPKRSYDEWLGESYLHSLETVKCIGQN